MEGVSTSDADADAEPVGRGVDDEGDDDTSPLPDFLLLGFVEKEAHELSATAGISSVSTAAAAVTAAAAAAAADPNEAVGHGGGGSDDGDTCLLLDLIKRHPDLFEEVLERLDPADRAFLGQVNHGCRAAVLASDLPCAGTRVGMRQLNPTDRDQLALAVRAFTPDLRTEEPLLEEFRVYSPLEALGLAGFVESSDLPLQEEL